MRYLFVRATLAAFATAISVGYANAQQFQAVLSGFNEIGGLGAGETGAIFSTGQGTLRLTLNAQLQSLEYTLTYSGLGTPVQQAHIHFGREHVAGGIMVFLCSNLAAPPVGTPACPSPSGTVTGTLTPASVIGPVAQGITPGNFAALAAALTRQTAYGNIHTTQFPAGEIRGELVQCNPSDNFKGCGN
jgi:CHRD domain